MSKKNEVALVEEPKKTGFIAIDEGGDLAEAMEANVIGGDQIRFSDIPTVSVPATAAGQAWKVEELGETRQIEEIEGLVVLWAVHGVLWGSETISKNKRPLLVTEDLKTAVKVSDDYGDIPPEVLEACKNEDGTYDWEALPYNKWGSGKGGPINAKAIDDCRQTDGSYNFAKLQEGRGSKRCKEMRYLGILPRDSFIPWIIRIPPSSIAAVSAFFRQLGMRRIPYWRVVAGLSLRLNDSGDQEYNEVVIRKSGDFIPSELGSNAVKMFTDPLKDAIRASLEASASRATDEQDDLR